MLHVYSDEQEFNDAPTEVKLEKEEYTVEVGKTDQIVYHLVPDPVDPDLYVSVDYVLDSEDIIELESSCLSFIGLKEGKVTATIILENYQTEEKFTKTVTINVKAKSNPKPNRRSSGSSSSSKKQTKGTIWSNVDDWAIEEMTKAEELGLIPETFKGKDFTESISRKDFAAVAVKLYEAITGKKTEAIYSNPFKDTNDNYVLLAYCLGITKGTSETTFSPEKDITREQMATMVARTLEKAGIDVKIDLDSVLKFADDDLMHTWGRPPIYFMSSKDIIKGVGDNKFNPLGEAKVEEALAIALRCKAKGV